MPFKSEKQRKYLWANEPAIARDWTDTYGSKIQKAKGGVMNVPRRRYFSGAYGQGAGDRGGDPRASAAQNRAAGRAGPAWSPGVGGTQHIPAPKKTITRDVKPTKQITRYINPRGMRNTGFVNQGNFPQRNWRNFGLQAIMNMPKYWSLPSDIRRLYEAGENIPISHGFESKKVKKAIKKGGFKNIRPQSKIPPTTDAIEAATKALLKGNLKEAYTKLGQTKGAFTAIGPTAKEAAISARKYAKPASDISRGVGKLGSLKNIVQGVIDPRHGYIDRGMTGNLQGRWNTGAVNKALGLGSKSAQVAGKPIAQSLLNKIGARALPGANIALGGAAALGHLQAGKYGQAAMAGLSMAPGPLGWAGLAGEMGLGALSRMTPIDPNALENTLVMKEGGIARLPFANGGFNTGLLDYYLQKDPLLDLYKSQGLLAEENILPYSADPKGVRDPKWAKEMDEETLGYTRPGRETNLYLNELEKFGMQPSGPLYGAPVVDTNFLESEAYTDKAMGVDKFGNEITRPQTYRELMTSYLNAPKGSYKRDFATQGMIEDNPTITERNKQIGETIGHEARHQLLGQNPEFYENIDDDLVPNIGVSKHELLNRMLDFQAYNDAGIYSDIYDDMHEDMPRHLSSPIADAFSEQATAFTNKMLLPKDEEDVNLGEEVRRLIEDVNLGGVSRRSVRRRPVQGAAATTKQNFINRLRNRFYKPATSAAGGYGIAQLNRMNALGGYYSEPARQQRRTDARIKDIENRARLGKPFSQKNYNELTMGKGPPGQYTTSRGTRGTGAGLSTGYGSSGTKSYSEQVGRR